MNFCPHSLLYDFLAHSVSDARKSLIKSDFFSQKEHLIVLCLATASLRHCGSLANLLPNNGNPPSEEGPRFQEQDTSCHVPRRVDVLQVRNTLRVLVA